MIGTTATFDWLDYDGRVVKLDGINHVLRCNRYKAIYPYERIVTTVHAEPQNRTTRYYRDIRRELGDDWSTDILQSDVTIQCEVMAQLELSEQSS